MLIIGKRNCVFKLKREKKIKVSKFLNNNKKDQKNRFVKKI